MHVKSLVNRLAGKFREDEKLWEYIVVFAADTEEQAEEFWDAALVGMGCVAMQSESDEPCTCPHHRFSCLRPLGS